MTKILNNLVIWSQAQTEEHTVGVFAQVGREECAAVHAEGSHLGTHAFVRGASSKLGVDLFEQLVNVGEKLS